MLMFVYECEISSKLCVGWGGWPQSPDPQDCYSLGLTEKIKKRATDESFNSKLLIKVWEEVNNST